MVVVKKNNALDQDSTEALKLNGVRNRISKVHATAKAKSADNAPSDSTKTSSKTEDYLSTAANWRDNLTERSKDLLSTEASSVATAAAIVVGAALIEVELIPGLIIGAGAILLGKLFPEATKYVRPAIKGAVRAGFSATNKIRQIVAEANEQVNDLVAEVMHEKNQPKKNEGAPIKPEVMISDLSTH